MGVRLSKIKRPKSRRKKKHASTSVEISQDHASLNVESQDQVYFNVKSHDHNPFSVSNWEQNPDNLTDDEKSDYGGNNYEDLDDDSLYTTTADGIKLTDELYFIGETKDEEKDEDLYDQVPADKYKIQSSSNKPNNFTKQISSFDSAYSGDLQSNSSKASFNQTNSDYFCLNDLQNSTSSSPLKSSDTCYVGSSECYERAPVGTGMKMIKEEKSRKLKTVEMPENLVPQMVEAFRPLIEECIRVNEVLPYLHFLANKDVIEAKERESPKRAAGLLLDQINASDELGKWTTFISALKTVGYNYVANILLGVTELDLTVQRNLLKVFIPELINNLQPSELIDHLYSRDVIGGTDKEEIECELKNRGSSAASLMLLDRIPRRIQNWYSEFVGALRACGFGFLADNIDIPEVTDTSSSDCSSTTFHASSLGTPKKSLDNWYITPNASTSDLSSPTPPPVPKRPETIGTNANKRAMPCSVTSISLLTKENIKSASHVDLLNEKRRLAVELEDVKQKRILKKDIKHLRKQIELLENDESDDSEISSDVEHKPHTFKSTKTIKKQEAKVERKDKGIQAKEEENTQQSPTQTDSIGQTSNMKTGIKNGDIKLSEITLNEFLDVLKNRIPSEVIQAFPNPCSYADYNGLANVSARNNVPINELVNILPQTHTRFCESASDSGMYSNSGYIRYPMSALYSDAPSNYD